MKVLILIGNIANKLKNIQQKYRYNFYQKYLLKQFSIEFIFWLTALFIVLLSLTYIDLSHLELKKTIKIFLILSQTFIDLLKIFDVITLCVCISFFIRSKKHINFCILNSFGIKSIDILRPLLHFLFVVWLLKTFLFQPVNSIIYNNTQQYKKNDSIKVIKKGDNINVIGKTNDNVYMIKGVYNSHNNKKLLLNEAVLLWYNKGNNLEQVILSKNADIKDYKIIFYQALVVNNIKNSKSIEKQKIVKTSTSLNEFVSSFFKETKKKKSMVFNIYDSILILTLNNTQNNLRNLALYNVVFSIIDLLNLFICCFLSFIFCISNGRQENFLLPMIKSFLLFFIVIRVFHFFSNEMINSILFSHFVLFFNITTLIIFYLLIYEKDFNRKITNRVKTQAKRFNTKLLLKTIKTIIKISRNHQIS